MPTPPPNTMPTSQKGFFGKLFNASFSEFITPSIVKVVYVIWMVLLGVGSVVLLIAFANLGSNGLIIGLIIIPPVALLYLMFFRMMLEIYVVLFKIEENTRK